MAYALRHNFVCPLTPMDDTYSLKILLITKVTRVFAKIKKKKRSSFFFNLGYYLFVLWFPVIQGARNISTFN